MCRESDTVGVAIMRKNNSIGREGFGAAPRGAMLGVRLPQTLLPISNLSTDCKSSALRCEPLKGLASVLRLASLFVVTALVSGPSFEQNENNGYPEGWTHHHKRDRGSEHGCQNDSGRTSIVKYLRIQGGSGSILIFKGRARYSGHSGGQAAMLFKRRNVD
jgi:hypothetical protein